MRGVMTCPDRPFRSHQRLMQQLLEPIIAEARRLEQAAGVPPGTAVIRWEQDERGWPVKAVVEIPQEVAG